MSSEYEPKNLKEAAVISSKPPSRARLDEGFDEAPLHHEADPLEPVAPSKADR